MVGRCERSGPGSRGEGRAWGARRASRGRLGRDRRSGAAAVAGMTGLDAAGFDVFHATLCRRSSEPMGRAGSWVTGMIEDRMYDACGQD